MVQEPGRTYVRLSDIPSDADEAEGALEIRPLPVLAVPLPPASMSMAKVTCSRRCLSWGVF